MIIGMTYDLKKDYLEMGFSKEDVAEFDSEETIDAIAEALKSLGYDVIRIGNVYELTKRLLMGERWDMVFNIAEGLYGRNREAQIPALLEAYNIPYTFSDPLTLSLCLDKGMAKRVVRDGGIPTPEFLTVRRIDEIDGFDSAGIRFPVITKPIAEGTGKGIGKDSVIYDEEHLRRQVMRLLSRYKQPVLIERFLTGKEYTAGIIGTGSDARVIGILEVRLRKTAEPLVYSYLNKESYKENVDYTLIEDRRLIEGVSRIALDAYTILGCRDAGRIDLREDDDGNLYFLEMNPLAGLHPIHSDLPIICSMVGVPYKELIGAIIGSASKRLRDEGSNRLQRAC
ncbi:MAG: ATP-grasp domain-containing protein [Thermodesulfovibrionia bacterium]